MNMKLVSVIVLAYRSAETIEQTLDSIKNQTYGNIELIVTDDCSPDNTVEVADKWINKNKGTLFDIKLVTAEKNTGIPGNINRALKQAKGDYIKIIAADDYMADEAVSEYVEFCEANPRKLPIAKVHLFSDEKADFGNIQKYCEVCYEFAGKDYKEQKRLLLVQNRIVAPSGSFYPMEFIKKAGGYDEHYIWFEDYPMNLKAVHEGYGFGLIDRELVWYRISGNSVTASRQLRLKKTEAKLFFRLKFWYLLQAKMVREALGQSRYWLKILLKK